MSDAGDGKLPPEIQVEIAEAELRSLLNNMFMDPIASAIVALQKIMQLAHYELAVHRGFEAKVRAEVLTNEELKSYLDSLVAFRSQTREAFAALAKQKSQPTVSASHHDTFTKT